MKKWIDVVTHPLGLAGFALFLIFIFLPKFIKGNRPFWLFYASYSMALMALLGGIVFAFWQSQFKEPFYEPKASTIPDTLPSTHVKQKTHGNESPAIGELNGNANITFNQEAEKQTSSEISKSLEKSVTKKSKQQINDTLSAFSSFESKLKAPPSVDQLNNLSQMYATGAAASHSVRSAALRTRIDKILDEMDEANIAFNHPEQINIADPPVLIKLVLSKIQSTKELSETITTPGKIEGAKIKVVPKMEARLTGSGFRITAINDEAQIISSKEITEWKWEIKPLIAGSQKLHLTLTAHIFLDNFSTTQPRTIRTFDRTIFIEITNLQKAYMFVGENWQWLLGTIVIPLGVWVWNKQRKTSSEKA